ncbi:CoF synthetase [Flavivirga amylovorans]|uniref:CoF synthetase n=1 Tax=Flavivirga amylovorans TaxID=870486 RepID=A0ABT8X1R8_9FLAO|nr:CoF synthetase [Flavivirga amylovorans]MDO5987896.1 CoF synthetase [Flavivirga amylovorans]
MKLVLSILEHVRFVLFWHLDVLNGAKISRHYRNISFILENFSSPKSKALREKNLKNLLNHANKHTVFYKDFIKLEDFPVINKNILRARIKEFKSSRFINKKTRVVSTSGSTGSALKINQNQSKVARNTADSIYFGKLAGFKVGYKLLYLRHWDDLLRKPLFTKFAQNIEELEVVNLNDSYIESIINKIKNDKSSKGWLGYASGYELICKYLDKTKSKPVNSYVKSIVAMSEGLNKYTKRSMQKYFNADVVSRYSNTENGIIAQQKINSDSFTINWASFYVEIFKLDEDVPVTNGEAGRIIITDLHNYAIPLIRYDTGDVGTINHEATPPLLKNIEGRKADVIYNTKGDIVSSFIVANVVEYEGVIQGQLIQETQKGYLLKLNITNKFKQEVDIINEFKSYLGNDAEIKIVYVDEIPLLSSGKRKATVNNYSNNNFSD